MEVTESANEHTATTEPEESDDVPDTTNTGKVQLESELEALSVPLIKSVG